MKKIRAIFCDLDGTLLDSQGCLSSVNSRALDELYERGIIFVPTTGRAFGEMPSSVREHKSLRYYLCSNGSVFFDKQTGEKHLLLMPASAQRSITHTLEPYEYVPVNHVDNDGWIPEEQHSVKVLEEYNVEPYFVKHLMENTLPVSNFKQIFEEGRETEMMCAFFRHHSDAPKAARELAEIEGIRITASAHGSLEIISGSAGKANAVRDAASLLGLELGELMVAGDSGNDKEMLAMVFNSYAMENASDEVKAVASFLGCSNDDHIADYLLRIIKGE